VGKNVQVRVLHPLPHDAHGPPATDNANSIVLSIEFAGRRVLLPGDLEGPGLASLLQTTTAPYDVIMAPHHGSVHSQPPTFARWARPAFVIVCDQDPSAEGLLRAYAAQGARVCDTARYGALQVRITRSGRMSVRHWSSDGWSPNLSPQTTPARTPGK
jgi:competence protein ComEC